MSNVDVTQAVLDQQKRRAQQSTFEPTDLAKYFTIALPQGVSSGEKIFRILPPMSGPSPFMEVYFHVVEVGGKMRKLWDPDKNEKKPSPLTEVYKALMATGDPADKSLAGKFKSRLFYIIKGIERGKEHEGVKFWRFPHEQKGGGVFDIVAVLFKKYGDITDPLVGRDLEIQLKKVRDPRGKEYTDINTIIPSDPKPLSDNADLAKEWLEDKTTWENVYKKYDQNFLQIVAERRVPVWSEAEGKWIPKVEVDEETGAKSNESPEVPHSTSLNTQTSTEIIPEGAEQISDEDLPF